MPDTSILSRSVIGFALIGVILTPQIVEAAPWEYSCKSALDDVESARDDVEYARSDLESSYEQYKDAVDDYNQCRLYPEVYDLLEDGCQSKRWEVESAKSSAESDLSTFNWRLKDLFGAVEDTGRACGSERAQSGTPSARICRLVAMMKTNTPEQKILALCRNLGIAETECRRCMQ